MQTIFRRCIAAYPEFFLAWLCYSSAVAQMQGQPGDGYVLGILFIEMVGLSWMWLAFRYRDGQMARLLLGVGRTALGLFLSFTLLVFGIMALLVVLAVDAPLFVLLVGALFRRQLWFWAWRLDAVENLEEVRAVYYRTRRAQYLSFGLAFLASLTARWVLGLPTEDEVFQDVVFHASLAGYFCGLGVYQLTGRYPKISSKDEPEKPAHGKEIPGTDYSALIRAFTTHWSGLLLASGFLWLFLWLLDGLLPEGVFITLSPMFFALGVTPLLSFAMSAFLPDMLSPAAVAWQRKHHIFYTALTAWFVAGLLVFLSVPLIMGLLEIPRDTDPLDHPTFTIGMFLPIAILTVGFIRLWPALTIPLAMAENKATGSTAFFIRESWQLTAGLDGFLRGGAPPTTLVLMVVALSTSLELSILLQALVFVLLLPVIALWMAERTLVMLRTRTDLELMDSVPDDQATALPDSEIPIPVPIIARIPVDNSGTRQPTARPESYTGESDRPPAMSNEDRFFDAIFDGDTNTVEEMLDAGVSTEEILQGVAPIIHAVRHSRPDIVRLLLQRGADPTVREDPPRQTLLHIFASSEQYPDLIEPMVTTYHIDPNVTDDRGSTALHAALKTGQVENARVLMKLGQDPLAVNEDRETTLICVASSYPLARQIEKHPDTLSIIDELLAVGVDPHAGDRYGQTMLTIAASAGRVAMLKRCQALGVDLDQLYARRLRPIQAAAANNQVNVVRLYQSLGIPLDLHSAVVIGDVDLINRLLDEAPTRINLQPGEPVERYGIAPAIYLAILNQNSDVVNLLLDRGASPKVYARTYGGWLYHLAKNMHDGDIAKRMIKMGANIEAADGNGNTALNMAARYNNIPVAEALLEAGADPNSETERGYRVQAWAKSKEMKTLLARYGGEYTGGPY